MGNLKIWGFENVGNERWLEGFVPWWVQGASVRAPDITPNRVALQATLLRSPFPGFLRWG